MNTRIFKWTLSIFIAVLLFQSVNIVKADDEYEHDEHENYESYEKDNGDWEVEDETEEVVSCSSPLRCNHGTNRFILPFQIQKTG